MSYFVIATGNGLTQRLIQADDEQSAVALFLFMWTQSDSKKYRRTFTLQPDELQIHSASDQEIASFHRGRRKRTPGDDQMALFDMPRHASKAQDISMKNTGL